MSTTSSGTGWMIEHVDDVPPVKPDWPATWKSIRHHFNITAFGINAVTKEAGNVLIPEHDETESGQQELYFVHKGEVRRDAERRAADGGRGRGGFGRTGDTAQVRVRGQPHHAARDRRHPGRPYEIGEWER